MGERETRDTAATTRSQSVVHYIERNHDDAARLLGPLLERGGAAEKSLAVLVVVPSTDDVLALASSQRKTRVTVGLTPITSVTRGRRQLSTWPHAVVGTARDLAALIAESRLSLAALQSLAVIWPEEIVDTDDGASLEQLLGEIPRPAERLAAASARPPALAQFLERSMWRARTVDHVPSGTASSAAFRILTATQGERLRALRTVLDAYDPPSAVLLAFSDEAESAARQAAELFGANGNLVSVHRGVPDEQFGLAVIFDDVPSADALDAAAGIATELIALVRPERLAALKKVAPNATPVAWTGALGNARSAHDTLREEIRGLAASGAHMLWVPLIEPLLEELDAVDVAAAALSMLDRERRRIKRAATATPAPPPVEREARSESFKRPREERGGDRPARGFSRFESGWKGGSRKPDDDSRRSFGRDRGERDRGASGRGERDRGASGRGERDRGASGRGDRGRGASDRGDHGRGASDRPREGRVRDDARERRGSRDDIERMPRAAHEGREWSERGDRLRHSRRGPRRDEGGGRA